MRSVLIIEDEELLRNLLSEIVTSSGHSVYEAANGAEALTLTKKNKFDLVISDIDMPIKNGIEFLREFRQADRSTPVLIMSGGDSITEQELMKLGATKFVPKPFPRDILSLLDNLLAA